MLKDFIKEAADGVGAALHTATAEHRIEKGQGAIRIRTKRTPPESRSDIYDRARVIYSRARRPHMARATGIF